MKNQENSFNQFYSRDGFYFSQIPSDGMINCLNQYEISGGIAVDIGAGEGRNAIYLAERGFDVFAIEPNLIAVNKIRKIAVDKKLNNLRILDGDFLSVADRLSEVDFVVALTSLEHMDESYLFSAVKKIKEIMKRGAYVYIIVFTVDDPGFKKDAVHSSECAMCVRHFFKHGELKSYFDDFEILEYKEYIKEDNLHGPLHYHGKAKLIAKKK